MSKSVNISLVLFDCDGILIDDNYRITVDTHFTSPNNILLIVDSAHKFRFSVMHC
jgi:beta-phosphoglucomutase-like phosphatase (HAD superfamily)